MAKNAAKDPKVHAAFHKACNTQFPTTSQGELTWILGMQIIRDFDKCITSLNQSQAILQFLEKWDARDSTSYAKRNIPMDANWKYGDEPKINDLDEIDAYRSKVASMNYFAMCTRPDISYAVNCLCRHMHDPNQTCLRAVRHLMGDLAATPHLGVTYAPADPSNLCLEAYVDSSFIGDDIEQCKSTTGYVIYFGGGPMTGLRIYNLL